MQKLRRHERPSLYNVKFQTLDGFELWITPYNRIFVVKAGTNMLSYPILRTSGDIYFDPPFEGPLSEPVISALSTILEKQRKLRRTLVAQGEFDDGDAWEWS